MLCPCKTLTTVLATIRGERVTWGSPFFWEITMRYFIILLLITACAHKEPERSYITLEQLRQLHVTQQDCPNIETLIPRLEQQQINAGIPRINPEDIRSDINREYQGRIRAAVWALRIGCENPNI